jgi:hypothetical protein
VLLVEGGILPELTGPYATVARLETALLRAHAGSDPETDAVFVAKVGADGGLTVDSVSGSFAEDLEVFADGPHCRFCDQLAERHARIAGVVTAGENNQVCVFCWDGQ